MDAVRTIAVKGAAFLSSAVSGVRTMRSVDDFPRLESVLSYCRLGNRSGIQHINTCSNYPRIPLFGHLAQAHHHHVACPVLDVAIPTSVLKG